MKSCLILGLFAAIVLAQASTFPDLNGQVHSGGEKLVEITTEANKQPSSPLKVSSGQLQRSQYTQTDNTPPIYEEVDDEELEMFLFGFFVVLLIFATVVVVVVAVAVAKHQKRIREQQKHQHEQLLHYSLPEQINYHYSEAHRLEILLQQHYNSTQVTHQHVYPNPPYNRSPSEH